MVQRRSKLQKQIMIELASSYVYTFTYLSNLMGVSLPVISESVGRLIDQGIVEKIKTSVPNFNPSKFRRYSFQLCLTEKGNEELKNITDDMLKLFPSPEAFHRLNMLYSMYHPEGRQKINKIHDPEYVEMIRKLHGLVK